MTSTISVHRYNRCRLFNQVALPTLVLLSILVMIVFTNMRTTPTTIDIKISVPNRSMLSIPVNYSLPINLNDENVVPIPCIEPNCQIDCMVLYPNHATSDKNNIKPLNRIQQQHLAIDLGTDTILNRMLNESFRAKNCTYKLNQTLEHVSYHPIVFGFIDHFIYSTIPKTVIVDNHVHHVQQMCLPKKSRDFSDLIPGHQHTYTFQFGDESDYRRAYASAYFAVTKKKSGWDCNRHYEIISSGTMPYFERLEQSGLHTMAHLPKPLLMEARSMIGINRDKRSIDHTRFNKTHYHLLLHRLLYYAKHRLTTRKLVEYILDIVHYNNRSNGDILFLSHFAADYMKDYMLHGFTQVFGSRLRTYNAPSFLYVYPRERPWTRNMAHSFFGFGLHAMGFGYALSLSKYRDLYERDRVELNDDTIVRDRIARRQYDLIVFGSIFRENRFFADAIRYYDKSRVIAIDGEDELKRKERSFFAKSSTYFLREIPDDCNAFS